jgi:hypothetical protein
METGYKIIVNGEEWIPREPEKIKLPSSAYKILSLAAMFGCFLEEKEPKIPSVNIIDEYEKINQK